jgi:hypothetical protein
MRTGIATVCLSGTLKEKMQACAIAGFDGIEIFEQDLVTSPLGPEDVRKMAADLGLGLDLYQPFRDFDGVTPDLLKANLRRAEAKFKLMSRLGMDTILVCSNVATATIDDDGLRASQLAELAELAGDHGVKVAYEALAWGKYVNDYEPKRSSSSRWRMLPSSPWTCCPGAGTTASSPAKASLSSPSSWATWSAPATPARFPWKSSTTCSASPTSNAPPWTPCAR